MAYASNHASTSLNPPAKKRKHREHDEETPAEHEKRKKHKKSKHTEAVAPASLASTPATSLTDESRKRKKKRLQQEIDPVQLDAPEIASSHKKKKKHDAPAELPNIAPEVVEKHKKKKRHTQPTEMSTAPLNSEFIASPPTYHSQVDSNRPDPSVFDAPSDPAASSILSAMLTASQQEAQSSSSSTTTDNLADTASNDLVLRALQDLDLGKLTAVLRSLEVAASAANVSLPTNGIMHPAILPPVNQRPPPAAMLLQTNAARSLASNEGYTNPDHGYLLANKWLSTTQLVELVKSEGLVYKKGKFSATEEIALNEAIENYRKRKDLSEEDLLSIIFPENERNKENTFWFEITSAVPQRPIIAVYHHVRRARHPLRLQGKWSTEEDTKLQRAVMSLGQAWTKVSAEVGRGAADCRDRWRNHLTYKDTKQSGHWSKDEEEKLIGIVKAMTLDKGKDLDSEIFWTTVAEKMGGTRTRGQCRIKWTDGLSATVKAGARGGEAADSMKRDRWSGKDAYILVHKLDSLQVADDSEVDWKSLMDSTWNMWSAHILQVRWQSMKKSIRGWEYMSFREVMDILKVKTVDVDLSTSKKKRKA